MNEIEQGQQANQTAAGTPEINAGKKQQLPPRERFCRSLFDWLETIVTAIVLVAVIFTFCVRIITVEGGSMKPTYHQGDRVLVSDLAGEIQRGDVVIIVNTLDEPIIKRVVALEGETVDFDPVASEVVVNGAPLPGAVFGLENGITRLPDAPEQIMEFPQVVPEGCVFVLGDNRGNSTDSRYIEVGMVDKRNILGKVILDVYPFSGLGFLK